MRDQFSAVPSEIAGFGAFSLWISDYGSAIVDNFWDRIRIKA
jgi:hypothetical protein